MKASEALAVAVRDILTPDVSWLAGSFILEGGVEAHVNTHIPYIAIDNFFAQGEDAEIAISLVHRIWVKGDCSIEEALEQYAKTIFTGK